MSEGEEPEILYVDQRLTRAIGATLHISFVRICGAGFRDMLCRIPAAIKAQHRIEPDAPFADILRQMQDDPEAQGAMMAIMQHRSRRPAMVYRRDGDLPDHYKIEKFLSEDAVVTAYWEREYDAAGYTPRALFRQTNMRMAEPPFLVNAADRKGAYTAMQARLRKKNLDQRIFDDVRAILADAYPAHFSIHSRVTPFPTTRRASGRVTRRGPGSPR